MVVEDLGLAQDGPLAGDAGIEIPDCDLVAVGGALAAVFRFFEADTTHYDGIAANVQIS